MNFAEAFERIAHETFLLYDKQMKELNQQINGRYWQMLTQEREQKTTSVVRKTSTVS